MKRPHRSIETFDISLMAVVTKAMGAFLVLMLLLMPYYSSSPLGKDEAQELTKKVQDADAKIKNVLDRLGDQPLGKELSLAREDLGSGEQLINQLKRYVDQLSSQVTRLEEKITEQKAALEELERLKRENAALKTQVADLQKANASLKDENEKLKAEIEKLKAEIEKLKRQIENLNKQIAELQKSEPEKVEELKKRTEQLEKRIKELEDEIARLKRENSDLNQRVAALTSKVDELKQENARLDALVAPLQQENADLKKRLQRYSHGVAGGATSDCGERFVLGGLSKSTYNTDQQGHTSPYILDDSDGLANAWSSELPGGGWRTQSILWGPSPTTFLYLLFRGPDEGSLKSPLQPLQRACVAHTALILFSPTDSSEFDVTSHIEPGSTIAYLGDAVFQEDGSVRLLDPSPEGQAYLRDQVDHAKHAKIEPPPPATPASSGSPAPTGAPTPAAPAPDSATRRERR